MRKFIGYLLSPFALLAALLVTLIFEPLQWLTYNVFGYKAHKTVVDTIHLGLFSSGYLLGNRVVFINKQNLPAGRPMIFIANHQSLFDISPLSWFLRKY